MVHFFGIMIRIILKPREMGGYIYYFQESPIIHVGPRYSVRLRG